jgi:hypothetical protein
MHLPKRETPVFSRGSALFSHRNSPKTHIFAISSVALIDASFNQGVWVFKALISFKILSNSSLACS